MDWLENSEGTTECAGRLDWREKNPERYLKFLARVLPFSETEKASRDIAVWG